MISLEYVAGFFDGEGCISINGNGRSFTLVIGLCQVEVSILQEIQAQFGGYLYPKPIRNRNANQCWELRWNAKAGLEFLKQITPFLRVKREQADFVILNEQYLVCPRKGRANTLSDEEVLKRLDLRLELAAMKPYSKILSKINVN